MKYMDEANFGFSHFDVDTQDFQIEGIFFDIYHLKISQTRKLLNFLRLFDQALSCDMQKKISGLLTKSWWWHYLQLWVLDYPFYSLKCWYIVIFIKLIS